MHGNAPQTGADVELSPEQRRALRQDCTAVARRARELLPDEFVVGSELVDANDGVRATVAVRPPGGTIVSAGFTADESADRDDIAHSIAATAALEAKSGPTRHPPTAR